MAAMMEVLLECDQKVFEFINGLHPPKLVETILTYWRNAFVWGPLYVFIISFAIFNFQTKAKWFIIFCVLTVCTTDFVSSNLIKKSVERLRPCQTEFLEVIQRVPCSRGYSFTSSHATNHFGIATFWVLSLSFIEKKYKIFLWFWAGLIGLCQIFVGVHYPSDVLVGSLLGIIIGYLYFMLFNKYYKN